MTKTDLTDKELSLIENSDFLLEKARVSVKINTLMETTRSLLQDHLSKTDFVFPSTINLSSGKISKGEYYRMLPYYVLDYPAAFTKRDAFALRTMFWWGNFFSTTLHLQGAYLDERRDSLVKNAQLLLNQDLYICVNDTPWEYHYEADNYELLVAEHIEQFPTVGFLKLSRKLELSQWETVPAFSLDTLKLFLSVLGGSQSSVGPL